MKKQKYLNFLKISFYVLIIGFSFTHIISEINKHYSIIETAQGVLEIGLLASFSLFVIILSLLVLSLIWGIILAIIESIGKAWRGDK